MAKKRIYELGDPVAEPTDHYIAVDKSGNASALKLLYSTLITNAVAASAPVITTPTITDVAERTVTTSISKIATHGKTKAIQLVFSVTFDAPETDLYINLSGADAPGASGQSLYCFLNAVTNLQLICEVYQENNDLILHISDGEWVGACEFFINGTLITTS